MCVVQQLVFFDEVFVYEVVVFDLCECECVVVVCEVCGECGIGQQCDCVVFLDVLCVCGFEFCGFVVVSQLVMVGGYQVIVFGFWNWCEEVFLVIGEQL